jgi:hypothetical protein
MAADARQASLIASTAAAVILGAACICCGPGGGGRAGASATALSRGASATALSRGAGHSSKTARGEVEIFPVEQHTGSAGCAVNTGAASGGAVWGEPQAA